MNHEPTYHVFGRAMFRGDCVESTFDNATSALNAFDRMKDEKFHEVWLMKRSGDSLSLIVSFQSKCVGLEIPSRGGI